jgi:tetratricopeptide (TPR) repeat protein
MKRPAFALLLLLAGACAYYNGMYNVKRLAGRARKAEREGRPFEAQGLWGQVAIKAESVVIRHPAKGWSDEARLLHGTALVRVNDCDRAIQPLEAVMLTSRHQDLAEEAALLVGGCRLKQGDPVGATEAYARLLQSREPDRRSLALLEHGRALRLGGQLEEALAELNGSRHVQARGERAAALATLGRSDAAVATADSLLAARDSTAPWQELLAALASHNPERAAALVDRVAADAELPATLRARLLLEDGLRWLASDTGRAELRFQEAHRTGKATPVQAEVRYQRARALLSGAPTLAALREATDRLEDVAEEPGTYEAGGAQLGAMARRVLLLGDSVTPGTPNGDLRLFLAGELARDSLAAGRLAADQFRRLSAEWPDSPFAPKAMLALIDLDSGNADSLRGALLARYAESPYVAMAQGGDAPAYIALEDSLRRFVAGIRAEPQRIRPRPQPPGRPQAPQPSTPRQPADN